MASGGSGCTATAGTAALLSLAFLLLQVSAGAGAGDDCHFPAVFNFGDSNSDTGGLSAAFGAAPPPNGRTFFGMPAGRYCDGRLVIDFIGGSSSRSDPRLKTRKRVRRGPRPDDTEAEREVVIPSKPTRREKSAAAKQCVAVPMHRWKQQDWEKFRLQNPYEVPVHPRWSTPQFRNEMQIRVVHELFEHNKNRYTKQWTIDLDHWRNHMDYFGEALARCEEFDLVKLMTINCDFDVQLIHQFYVTVHFGTDDARTLTFMCRDELFQVPWRAFCNALGYDDTGLKGIGGIRPHDRATPMLKKKLAPLYIRGRGVIGGSKDLQKIYDIMHRVFRNVLLPTVGNQDEIYGYLVDLLVAMRTQVGSGATFDVSQCFWEEMYSMVMHRKVPIYAPFIMCFLNSVWEVRRPGEPLTSPDNLTVHEVKQLRKKKHAEPRFPADDPEDVFATSSDEDFELEAGAKPSWVAKLTAKMKKTFCLQSHIQKKLYEAHVNEKMARRRQIAMMKHLNMQVASGSEKSITPEDRWIFENSTWTDDEAPDRPATRGRPATSTSAAADDDIMEEDDPEATEESEEN